jgi:hypothetical protein
VPVLVHELPGRDHALGLEADVDRYVLVVDREHATAHDLAFLDGAEALLEQVSEGFGIAHRP